MQIFVKLKGGKSIKICHAKLIRMHLPTTTSNTTRPSWKIFGWRVGGWLARQRKNSRRQKRKRRIVPSVWRKSWWMMLSFLVVVCLLVQTNKFHRHCIGKYIKEKKCLWIVSASNMPRLPRGNWRIMFILPLLKRLCDRYS